MPSANYPAGAEAQLVAIESEEFRRRLIEDQAWIDTEDVEHFNAYLGGASISQKDYDELVTHPEFLTMRVAVSDWLAERRLKEVV